jgi:hypothetical protein
MIEELTAGWSSSLRPRLRNYRSWVQIRVVSRGFCYEQLITLAHVCLYITYLCMFIRYLVTITQVL